MSIIDLHKKIPWENHCPDIEELVEFALGIRESSFVENHLNQCEICEDLAEGIVAFRIEMKGITPEAFRKQLYHKDEASLKTLKIPENHNDLISEIVRKLELPEGIEKAIRRVLASAEGDIFFPNGE